MPEPEKPEREPPDMEISDALKSVEGSEREKVIDAVSPAEREEDSEEREMEGGRVSIERVRELSGSELSTLKLPDASVNLELATEIRASVALSAVGVKIAV